MPKPYNIAYIDGQNLHMGSNSEWWKVDFVRFRIFLKDKFHVQEAYYFLWILSDDQTDFYDWLEQAWFVVMFREHSVAMTGKKKWNVDVDIVFETMKKLYLQEKFDKFVLVTWDGDYYRMVKFLIDEGKFEKILFPNKHHSSLYNKIRFQYGINLSLSDTRMRIRYQKKHKKKGVP